MERHADRLFASPRLDHQGPVPVVSRAKAKSVRLGDEPAMGAADSPREGGLLLRVALTADRGKANQTLEPGHNLLAVILDPGPQKRAGV